MPEEERYTTSVGSDEDIPDPRAVASIMSWRNAITDANRAFLDRVTPARLMKDGPSGRAVIACKDPRVNLAAIGIPPFGADGHQNSHVAIIRTAGARVDERSLLIGVFLAEIAELLILGHTDCGVAQADAEIETITARMQARVEPDELETFRDHIGHTDADLKRWLKTFTDPYEAVRTEIEFIRSLPFAPADLVVHGAVYDVTTGAVDFVS
jgi:carbonic anhydrase